MFIEETAVLGAIWVHLGSSVSVAQEIREQTFQEAQEVANALIAAEARIGEILLSIPKASGRPTENSSSGVEKLKSKAKAKGYVFNCPSIDNGAII